MRFKARASVADVTAAVVPFDASNVAESPSDACVRVLATFDDGAFGMRRSPRISHDSEKLTGGGSF